MFDAITDIPPAAVVAAGGARASVPPAPTLAPASPTPPASGIYTIAPGDTLDGIAAAHGTTTAALQALNPNITDPNKIQAGGTLNLNALGTGGGSSPLNSGVVSLLSKSAGSVPTSTSPIPADALAGTNSPDLSAILGRAVNGSTTSSDIAGLLQILSMPAPSSTTIDSLGGQIASLEGSKANEGDDLTTALSTAGVPESQQQLNDLNVQIAQQKGSLAAFDAETAQGLTQFAGQPITTGSVSNEQATYQKGRDLTKLAMTAELTANTALATAYTGNIDSATKLATQSVDLKYQGISDQITALQDQLTSAKDNLSAEDSKQNSVVSDILDLAKSNLTVQSNNEKTIQTIAVQAAANGAPLSVVNAIKASTDPASAATAAGQYTKGSAGGSTGTGGGGSGSGTGGSFSSTQLNKGAANAGVDAATFAGYDANTQNIFINGDLNKAKTSIDSAISPSASSSNSPASLDQVTASIQQMGLPPTVATYLTNYAKSKFPAAAAPAASAGGGFLDNVTSFLKSLPSFVGF